MPYINDTFAARNMLRDRETTPGKAGELNFVFTAAINDFLVLQGLSYSTINEAIGALECAKMELYRRIAVPYEDSKIAENGDVYSEELFP
jgi:hypothetical protein